MNKGWTIADESMGTRSSHPKCVQHVGAHRHSMDGVHLPIHLLVPLLEAQTRICGEECTCSVSAFTISFSGSQVQL